LLTRFTYIADEIWDRFTVQKISFVTGLGKRMMPAGHWHGTGEAEPSLYLTFDDGPDPETTPRLLELLAEHGVPATFFLVGSNCAQYPHLVRAIAEAGHRIGNHTYNHQLLPMKQTKHIEEEISRTNDVIEEITGVRPTIFRPPFGLMDERTARCLTEQGMTPVYWGNAPEDWLNPGSHRVIRRVMWKIADGSLIVLHEGSFLAGQTITAAKEIIYRCKSLGYQFSKVKVRA
jgi:peptidoglycan/xylan/chitin deacetylase (PgdA/CDA1 family)